MSIPITWWASKRYVYVNTLLEKLDRVMDPETALTHEDIVFRLEQFYKELKESE